MKEMVCCMGNEKTLVHGGDWAGYTAEFGTMPLDFSANVSPLGVPDGVSRAITQAAAQSDRYPDPLCRELCATIAHREEVPAEHILCGNGATDLIFRAALAGKPKKALLTAPTFAEYESALAAVCCDVVRYDLKEDQDFRLNEGFLRAITPDLDMVFLCEPNNPTGVTSPQALLLRIAEKCREKDVLLILDECFADFLDDPEAHTLKRVLNEFPNLLILKAFTKLFGMAGVRLGYCLCADMSLLEAMRGAGQPWAVSSLAQAAGIAALEERKYVEKLRRLIAAERPWLRQRLRALGLRVIPGEANYLLFACDRPLTPPLRQKGILVRGCANYPGLDGRWYRVAVRTHEENERLIASLTEVLS